MQNEFLMLDDHTDVSCSTSILHPSQLLSNPAGIKQSGANTRRIYMPNLGDEARVYTYNFEEHRVELDTILAVEHIVGEFSSYTMTSYQTTPTILTNYDKLMTCTRNPNRPPSFIRVNKITGNSQMILQVEKYNNLTTPDDIYMLADDKDGNELEIPMVYDIGVFVGSWLGNGNIRFRDGIRQIELYPKTEDDELIVLKCIEDSLPDSYEVTTVDKTSSGATVITIRDELLANWLESSHVDNGVKQFPSGYYSAPEEYVCGIIFGLMSTCGKISINSKKNVMYYTIASKSETLINQFIELLGLFVAVPASKSDFKISGTNIHLFIANIRVTENILNVLGLDISEDQHKFIPPHNSPRLIDYPDILPITRSKIILSGTTCDTYSFRMKNNNNLIGLNGLIYGCEVGLQL